MDKRDCVVEGLKHCLAKIASRCFGCPYLMDEYCTETLLNDTLEMMDAAAQAAVPRVIRPAEYDSWDADAWIEEQESGLVVALDRTAVPAYVKYIRFDRGDPKRLWTGRPSDEQRRETPWTA